MKLLYGVLLCNAFLEYFLTRICSGWIASLNGDQARGGQRATYSSRAFRETLSLIITSEKHTDRLPITVLIRIIRIIYQNTRVTIKRRLTQLGLTKPNTRQTSRLLVTRSCESAYGTPSWSTRPSRDVVPPHHFDSTALSPLK